MLYLSALLLFIGGLVPLIIGFKLLRVSKHVYLLGWLAWVFGISIKAVISYLLTNSFPLLLDYWPFIIFSTIIESTEVLSAYLFLKHHKGLKQVRGLRSLIGFGIGFGSGEAFSLAGATILPISTPINWISLTTIVERFSAVMIHTATALLIGYFIINKKKVNAILSLVCKDASALLTVFGFPLLTIYLNEAGLLIFELIILAYGASWLALAYWLGLKKKIKEKKVKAYAFNWNKTGLFSVLFLAVLIMTSLMVNPFTGAFIPASIIIVSIVSFIIMKRSRFIDEMLAGSFIGFVAFVISTFNGLPTELLELVSTQSLIGIPALAFSGVILGWWFYKRSFNAKNSMN